MNNGNIEIPRAMHVHDDMDPELRRGIAVFVNGRQIPNCIEYNQDEGWASQYETDHNGYIKATDGLLRSYKTFGDVVVTLNNPPPPLKSNNLTRENKYE